MKAKDLAGVIQCYLEKGFGSMNKNDFEVWIFHYLLSNQYKSKKDYEISIALGIPLTKVKRLRYEAGLKYGENGESCKDIKELKVYYSESFNKLLDNLHFVRNGEFLMFVVEDISFRKYLEFTLRDAGHLTDGSFSSDIITMNFEAFDFLLKHFWTEEEYEEFLKKAEQEKKKKTGKTEKITVIGLLKELGKTALNTTVSELVKKGFSFSIKALPYLIELIF